MTMLILTLLVGCENRKASEASWTTPELEALHTRFRGVDDRPVEPELAFAARAACPVVERAIYRPGAKMMGTLDLYGRHLDRIQLLGGVMSDGTLAEARPHPNDDGSVSFAVGCRSCLLVPAFELEGRRIGCTGPGHSVRLERGAIRP